MDLFDLIFDLAWYAEHWRGLAGLALLIGGLFLAFGPSATLVPGLIVAAIGFGFIIWEILSWFERRDS